MKNEIFKKVIFAVIVVILSSMGALSFSMFGYAKGETSYNISFENVMIEKIGLNSNEYPLKSFVRDNLSLNEEKNMLVADGIGNIEVKANVVDDFYVKFKGDQNNITITKDGVEQELSENDYLFIVNIKDVVVNSISISTLIYFIVFLPVMTLLLFGLKYVFGKIRDNNLKYYDILLYIVDVFLVYLFTFYAFSLILRKFIFLPIALFICYGIYVIATSKEKKYENIYAIFAVIAGVSILFLMAPFNVPDEASHYLRSYKESTLSFEYDGGYYKFPKPITEFIYKYNRNLHSVQNKLYAENYLSEFGKSVDYNVEAQYETDYRNVVDLSVIPYIPSAIVIFFARLIHLSPLVMFLLSRLVNLTISVLGCYWAIKNIPCFKRVLTIVCLFPIFLQQATAINMDYFTNVVIIMLVSLIGLVLGKFGYFPVLVLLFLIPKEKFNNRVVEWIIKIGFIIAVLGFSLLINMRLATEQGTAPGQGLEVYGIKSFFTTPFTAVKVLLTTVVARIDQDLLRGFFDNFAYSTAANKAIFPLVMYFVYILLLFSKDEDDVVELPKLHRVFYIGSSLAIIAIVYAIAYSQWTSVGAAEISGLQARYFIATSALLYIGASNSLLDVNVKNKKILYTVLMATSLIISVITIGNFFS